MTRHPSFTWIVLAPGGPDNMRLALAAARSGAWGFVNFEELSDRKALSNAIAELATETADLSLGVKLDAARQEDWQSALERVAPHRVRRVLLSRPTPASASLESQITALHKLGIEVLIEAVGLEEALSAQEAGADAIVAKGSEAGGRIGEDTSFVLLQRLSGALSTPVFAQGGVGLHTAAACRVAGAQGAVLDWQMALAAESNLPATVKRSLSGLDGSETVTVGGRLGDAYRVFLGGDRSLLERIQREENRLLAMEDISDEKRLAFWRRLLGEILQSSPGARYLGMEISFASRLAAKFDTVGGILEAMERSLRFHLSRATRRPPLSEGNPLASSLGTRYPIVQGPMSRVSDTADFAEAVANAGGLPVLAVAAMRPDELEPMLRDTSEKLGDASWAAGLLGFLPDELYDAQVDLVLKHRPPAAVIAGGRPGQARQLEQEGIRTFIHVPSHRLLDVYLDDGVRNVIFEGFECGGHIGRFSGFVLWENVIEVLLAKIPRKERGRACAALFAGGVSTGLSAAMISAIAAPLVDRGIEVGVLMGTAYLFTREAVETGAITSGFQKALLEARETTVLDCGGGYQIRAAPNPFCVSFEKEKQRLTEEGLSADEVRMTLEDLTLGRLRIAAKGVQFNEKYREDPSQPRILSVPESDQHRDGVYMAGQAIHLHHSVYSVEDLHRLISEESSRLLRGEKSFAAAFAAGSEPDREPGIAVVGMSALFPGAADTDTYWSNILAKHYAITEVSPEQWDLGTYFDSDRNAPDKIYSRWGGFLDPIEFDPLRYGIPPSSLRAIDPFQLLALEMVDRALRDAGYGEREFDRENTSVFIGEGGGFGNLGQLYNLRSMLPVFLEEVPEEVLAQLPEWTEDAFPGLLPNVMAGRVANQFDLGGTNLSTSAACAAGLAAVSLGMQELRTGRSNLSIVGAIDVQQSPFMYLCFSKTLALSPTGTPRCFDASADGIVISQGVGAVVLKRLEDAERDGDRIYAVLRGVGSSSDGRGKSLTAPTSNGQIRAMRRAYDEAGFGIDTVGLIEAHGTGTVLGDRTEAESVSTAMRQAGAPPEACAIGTVKSMIGHTKGCAGIAGLVKVCMALHHRVLPPTIGVEEPTAPEVWSGDSPIYINTEARPWIESAHPRRAGVSSFGFGGTNFHVAVEEYSPSGPVALSFPGSRLPSELFCLHASSREELLERIDSIEEALDNGRDLPRLAAEVFDITREAEPDGRNTRLSVIADSPADLAAKLKRARSAVSSDAASSLDPSGVYFATGSGDEEPRLAFIFPGQGSQRVDMLDELTILFDELRTSFETADRTIGNRLPFPLSHYVYPPPSFTEAERQRRMEALTRTDVTQPALGAASLGLQKVLATFGVRPDVVAGHSVGEYVALCSAGVFDERTLYELLWTRGSCMLEASGVDSSTMMAIRGDRTRIEAILQDEKDIFAANFNAPSQTVVSGRKSSLEALRKRLAEEEIEARLIPVGCGFHSPYVGMAAADFDKTLERIHYEPARLPVYSNRLADVYPDDDREVRKVLSEHLSRPVRFLEEIEKMHADGVRIFLEVGPGRVCTGLIAEILDGEPNAAISCDGAASRSGTTRFLHALGQLFAHGVDLSLEPLFTRRRLARSEPLEIPGLPAPPGRPKVPWMVSPEISWPAGDPRPRITPVSLPSNVIATSTQEAQAMKNESDDERLDSPGPSPKAEAAHLGASSTAPAPIVGGELTDMMSRHQRLMNRFLEQQEKIMLAYLETGASGDTPKEQPGPAHSPADIETAPEPARVAARPPTAAPVRTPASTPAEASRSTTAETEDAGETTTETAGQPAAAAAATVPGSEELTEQLIALVAERTGYPSEMLDGGQDMEADLGIDSIKRVEILTSFARRFPDLDGDIADQLREVRTLADVVSVTRSRLEAPAATQPGAATPAEASRSTTAETEDAGETIAETAGQPAAAAAATVPGSEELMEQLIALVAERTGYPSEMLDGGQDMEADLGIDSIKRVEILTSFARRFPDLDGDIADQLREVRTLADVVSVTRSRLEAPAATQPGASTPAEASRSTTAETEDAGETIAVKEPAISSLLDRYVIGVRESALAGAHLHPVPEGALVITDDGRGYAESLAAGLRERGGHPVRVCLEGASESDEQVYVADLSDPDEVKDLIDRIRAEHGSIGALFHLLPLREPAPYEDLSDGDFSRLVAEEIKGLFHLLRYAAEDLRSVPDACIFCGLSFGAPPGEDTLPVPRHPWRGGLIGIVKTVATEWPEVSARAVVIDGPEAADFPDLALAELAEPGVEGEVYYASGSRLVPEPRQEPLLTDRSTIELTTDDVVVLIGGARGITAEVGRELASLAQPTLVLVGRSPWPESETEATAAARSASDLRRAVLARLQADGENPSPKEVDEVARRILREREMRQSRRDMEQAGARVVYLQADLRDGAATETLLEQIYAQYGGIDGVVCGAGIIEDRLIEDKTPDSFDRVFDTKARAVFHLARFLRPEKLKFLVLFSSIAGWTGNRGQVDYVAANELLNRTAAHLNARWERRVVAIDWGPWETSGMVTDEIRRQFIERKVGLVPPEAGRRFLVDEIRFGDLSDSVVAALGRVPTTEAREDLESSPVATGAP